MEYAQIRVFCDSCCFPLFGQNQKRKSMDHEKPDACEKKFAFLIATLWIVENPYLGVFYAVKEIQIFVNRSLIALSKSKLFNDVQKMQIRCK